jgi:hypothetical protein
MDSGYNCFRSEVQVPMGLPTQRMDVGSSTALYSFLFVISEHDTAFSCGCCPLLSFVSRPYETQSNDVGIL